MRAYGAGAAPPSHGKPRGRKYDGTRLQEITLRKGVDLGGPTREWLEVSTHVAMRPPHSRALTTRYCMASSNKVRNSVNCVSWTPGGRRVLTGSAKGEFTLWDGTCFNFVTTYHIISAAVRCAEWTPDGRMCLLAYDNGAVHYRSPAMVYHKSLRAHDRAVRGIAVSPSSTKFATGSDDKTVCIWDLETAKRERMCEGHGANVRSVSWHPRMSLVASGSKDNSTRLWDPRTGSEIFTLHGHRADVEKVEWNRNGVWLLAASRDQTCTLTDVRTMRAVATFRDHDHEITAAAWHTTVEDAFVVGTRAGSLLFWSALDETRPTAEVWGAHQDAIWDVAFDPHGQALASASNDKSVRFWSEQRPGDKMNHITNTRTRHEAQEAYASHQQSTYSNVARLAGAR